MDLSEYVISITSGKPTETIHKTEHRQGHTPSPRIEIRIPDSAGNRTRAAGLESRDSTDHATPKDIFSTHKEIMKIQSLVDKIYSRKYVPIS